MARFKMVNGERKQLTDAEETARDAEEKEWADAKPARRFMFLRRERNQKLVETDFYANSDVTMSDDMKAYRKALRDLPATLNNTTVLDAITWPDKP